MLLPYHWLQEFVPVSLTPRETAYLLTQLGLEVEAQEEVWGSPVFDIKVTPQRGDCLSALGIARELAAALRLPLKVPIPKLRESGSLAAEVAAVEIQAPDLCPRYSARVLRGVKVGLSPGWLRQRLEQGGLRPINNVVDVTNLVMLERGQPLHAFDVSLLRPKSLPAIVVRRARAGERITALDGEDRALTSEMLVIADGERPVAIAGVMGGANSEVRESTTTLLLESAHFCPLSIRRTAKALGMMSEASYRFERRVDPDGTIAALDRAAELIFQLAGGEIASGVIDVYPQSSPAPQITLRAHRVNQLLGTALSPAEMADCLLRLGLQVEIADENLRVQVPSWRGDLNLEEDLTEEIARMHGYDNIPSQPVLASAAGGRRAPSLALEEKARRTLLACGLNEAITYSLEGPQDMTQAGFPADHPLSQAVLVKNPKVEEYSRLRTSLLPSLLALLARNWRRGLGEAQVFEIGRVYLPQTGELLPQERLTVGVGLFARQSAGEGWGKRKIDFYALKGVVEEFLHSCGATGLSFAPLEHLSLAPGQAAQVLVDGQPLGILGRVRDSVLANYDLPRLSFLAEIDLEAFLHRESTPKTYQPISRFPAIERDLALLVPLDCAAAKVEDCLRRKAGDTLESLALFDVYEGSSLLAGHRSLAYSLTFRAHDRTLTEAEVEALIADIEKALGEIGVALRR